MPVALHCCGVVASTCCKFNCCACTWLGLPAPRSLLGENLDVYGDRGDRGDNDEVMLDADAGADAAGVGKRAGAWCWCCMWVPDLTL